MGQTHSYKVYNVSDFDSAEISIDGKESSIVSKGRSVELQPENYEALRICEAGKETISVVFCVNDEGILKVRAEVVSMGTVHELEITEYRGRLTMDELLNRQN
ncbi:unnamed protein product [Oppiella nova]|uniref:Uncharacterized protein n=1 Tax=Oppiella nova TaxID=334625 RepID=A0A7R9QCS2_9ACAR|nr:unnamed protein product [Oppiella nova]CAG2163316.1 unnamed protein product [Oppiella nova]